MERKLLEEEMRVINNVVDKKIENVMDKLLIKVESLDKRISNLERDRQTIFQELNFYINDSLAVQFHENLHILWKIKNDIEWIDDITHIRKLSINNKYGSRARVIRTIIIHIDDIYIINHKLHSQFLHDLAIILGYNACDPKSFAIFRSAYNHESFKNEKK
jgi:hypothetical protein